MASLVKPEIVCGCIRQLCPLSADVIIDLLPKVTASLWIRDAQLLSKKFRLLVEEWQCMQLIRTSFAWAALCYLPAATAGLEITSSRAMQYCFTGQIKIYVRTPKLSDRLNDLPPILQTSHEDGDQESWLMILVLLMPMNVRGYVFRLNVQ
ncbi:hypothetical protein M436DRAFT_60586 [Aureobasidium namibiae CBS 147.97]|uniref:Uncharacterized protein n=1 Tax=Aureobasidium namibiae CBS 147.97 TaxID=1043004 RepID=A0A074XQ89_9PEZI|nr:uncharacterized protein M436DRAFT_60586 [Aureobasidium namibiae CBS 147.97]KEQ76771.1 hypothetical protein M436DRAFT_60586 [Aureobasidium namibiae CBS 147.97]